MANFKDWQNTTRAELEALYKIKPMTAIAAIYEITPGAVSYRLRTWGLKKGQKHTPGPKPSFIPDPKELARLYRQMSMRDIAIHYGVGETVVFNRIKALGLPPVSRSDRLKGRPKSEQHRANMSAQMMGKYIGDKNPNWRGGTSQAGQLGRSRAANRVWKDLVLAAAEHKCERCGVEQGSRCECCGHIRRLHVHHKRGFAKHPELRVDLDNGEALCEKCHYFEHHVQTG